MEINMKVIGKINKKIKDEFDDIERLTVTAITIEKDKSK